MNNQLHATTFVEESFGDDGRLSWHRAQYRSPGNNILHNLLGTGVVQSTFFFEPLHCSCHFWVLRRDMIRRDARCQVAYFRAHFVYLRGGLRRGGGCFAIPERHARRCSMGILYDHSAGFSLDTPYSPGSTSQQYDVSPVALDCEVFIEGADDCSFWFGNHRKQAVLWDGATTGNGSHARPPAGANSLVYAVAVQISAVAKVSSRKAFGEHLDY